MQTDIRCILRTGGEVSLFSEMLFEKATKQPVTESFRNGLWMSELKKGWLEAVG
jgi:hypothetical protein